MKRPALVAVIDVLTVRTVRRSGVLGRLIVRSGRVACGVACGAAGFALVLSGCADAQRDAGQQFVPRVVGELRVATALPAPGFWEGDDAESLNGGFEWALAKELADRLDLELVVVDMPFADIAAGELGDVDMAIAQISITDARAKRVDFSTPYYNSDAGVLGAAGVDAFTDLLTARERTWVVVEGTTEADFVADIIDPDRAATVVADERTAAMMVARGEADVALMDLPTALVLASRDDALTVSAKFETNDEYGIAMPRASGGATADGERNRQVIDAALRALDSDGTISDLDQRWLTPLFGVNPDDIAVVRAR